MPVQAQEVSFEAHAFARILKVETYDTLNSGVWLVESRTSLLRRDPWIEVFEEHIELPDGGRVDDFYTIRLRDFVTVVALTEAGEVVCVRHYRHGCGAVVSALPSGFIEPEETPREAAARELLEETGFVADEWADLGRYAVDGNRGCGQASLFLARGARKVRHPDGAEDLAAIAVETMAIEEAARRMFHAPGELASAAALGIAIARIKTESHQAKV